MTTVNRGMVLRQILEEKQRTKQRAESLADEKRERIAEQAPLYANMQDNITKIYMELSRDAISGELDADALSKKGYEKVMQLKAKAEAELAKAGYTPADLAPDYECPLCEDTGFVGEIKKQRCSCVQKELMRRLYDQAGIGGQTFENFDLGIFPEIPVKGGESQRKWMESAKRLGERYAEGFPNNRRKNLLMTGYPGLGKTYLMNCIAARILDKGYSVMRLTAYRMFEIMRKYHRGQDAGEMEDMLTVDLLTIDDLGTEPMMENITVEYLFTLLNERRVNGLSTLIATNFDLQGLALRYTERVASRLADTQNSLVLNFDGMDLRRESR